MGRKSSKAKEKKQKHLEEHSAMDAICAKVDAANRLGDPLEAFPVFKKYDRNGLNVSIELQLESKVQRKGLGKFLIQILKLMANSTQMKKVMVTVFKHNHGAYQFFREAWQFEIDDSSPSMSGGCGEDSSYEILSQKTKFGDSQHSHAGSVVKIPAFVKLLCWDLSVTRPQSLLTPTLQPNLGSLPWQSSPESSLLLT
ncbi:N-acetyltransferase 11 [Heterocephalus glaber]|uniref:N-acetyltransferase 11 n=1 Tax=Heterocephalus glaber TaxID=10181 RepID=G5C3J9_HETGA|nr:N-acetyltransferase 11 [Heterocephalus glaber]